MSAGSAKDQTRLLKARVEAHFKGRRANDAMPSDEYLVLREVSCDDDGGEYGFVRRRRVDVVAVGIWKRTGHVVHGIETKVSRADWLAELRDPSKAQAGASRCDFWWLAVNDPSIVHNGELPDDWGLLVPSGRGLKRVVHAQRREGELDDRWVAALVMAAATQHSVCRGMVRVQERAQMGSEIRRLRHELTEAKCRLRLTERAAL